jgi:hypothetical protein
MTIYGIVGWDDPDSRIQERMMPVGFESANVPSTRESE